MARLLFLVISSFLICATSALNWTSLTLLSNDVTIPACIGANVSFPWQYEAEVGEHVVDVEWFFTPIGQVQTVLASQVAGNFLASPSAIQHVQYLTNAGLYVYRVTRADSGQYTVRVNMNLHGKIIPYATSVNLLVADPPVSDGKLHAQVLPSEDNDNTTPVNVTSEEHIRLSCGRFLRIGQPPVSVVWTTPTKSTLSSTSYVNGSFILNLPTPVATGDYSCQLQSSPYVNCLPSSSPLLQGASVRLHSADIELALLQTRHHALENTKAELETRLHQAEEKITNQNETCSFIQSEREQCREQVSNLTSQLTHEQESNQNLSEQMSALADEIHNQTSHNEGDSASRYACTTYECLAMKQTIPDSGVRTVWVSGRNIAVYCDQTTDGGGWTVFQRRQDGSVNFSRAWVEYENGFGDIEREFWLGLEKIHQLTSSGIYSLRIDLWDVDGTHIYAQYNIFYIDGASNKYTLNIAGYSGTAGDSMLNPGANGIADNMAFSTYDRDNDLSISNCASTYKAGWWYDNCQYSNLNGQYHADGSPNSYGVRWRNYRDDDRSFVRVEMKMRPRG